MCNPRMPLPRRSIRDVRSPALTPYPCRARLNRPRDDRRRAQPRCLQSRVDPLDTHQFARSGIGAPDRSHSQNTDQTGEASSRHASNLIGFMRAGLRQLAGVERSQSHQAEARAPVCCLPAAFSRLRPADREATGVESHVMDAGYACRTNLSRPTCAVLRAGRVANRQTRPPTVGRSRLRDSRGSCGTWAFRFTRPVSSKRSI